MTLTQIYDEYQPRPDKKPETPQEQRELAQQRNRLRAQLANELYESVVIRAVYSERRFNEVMVEFWRNHLNIEQNKARYLTPHYEENVLRKHAFGKFHDLIAASAKHPAMLVYLDNHVSRANNLNENYARELMELHTLGVDNYYTQKDVIELARVLTGWTCGYQKNAEGEREYGFIFNARNHDQKPASILSLSLDGKGGVADGEAAIHYLTHHEGTAQFISWKLCRYLVCDNPPQELVDRIAKVFLETDGELKEVYRAILYSDEFVDLGNFRVKFKTPFEFTVSALRATQAQIDKPRSVLRALELMGQPVYECIEPTGYYDQTEAWLDPGVIVYRWDFAINLVSGKIGGVKVPQELYAAWQKLPQSAKAREVMDAIVPGARDNDLKLRLSRIDDARGMMGLALGSPAFQQQ